MSDLKVRTLIATSGMLLGIMVAPPTLADLNDGLIAHYPFCGNAQDATGNNHDGTVHGATLTTDRFGNSGRAYSFDGTDDYVSVPDDDDWTLGEDPFTISVWVNFNSVNGRDVFIGHDEGPGNINKWIFWHDASGHGSSGSAVRFHTNSSTVPFLDPIVFFWTPNTGNWYHIGITRDDDTYTLYIDGDEVTSEEHSNVISNPATSLTIGMAENIFFDGSIDDVRIYDRALSDDEFETLYTHKDKCNSNLVTLTSFTVTPTETGVDIDWETSSEKDTAGFRVWRGELSTGGQCTRNPANYGEVVQLDFDNARGDLQSGATYSRTDNGVTSQTTYCYLLEDVEFNGVRKFHWDLMKSVTAK